MPALKSLLVTFILAGSTWAAETSSVPSAVRAKMDALRQQGLPVTPAELNARYQAPPIPHNAADIYLQGFSLLAAKDNASEGLPIVGKAAPPPRTQPLPPLQKQAIILYLGRNQQALDCFYQAAQMDECRFPVDYSRGFELMLPHLSKTRQGVRLLYLDAMVKMEDQNSTGVFQDLWAMWRLSNSIDQEPIIISQLVAIACRALTVSCLDRALNRIQLSEPQLAKLAATLAKTEDSCGMAAGMTGELSMGYWIYTHPREASQMAAPNNQENPLPPGDAKAAQLWDDGYIAAMDLMSQYVQAACAPMKDRIQRARSVEQKVAGASAQYPFCRFWLPALGRAIGMEVRGGAALRAARTAVAVERYRLAQGRLPASLSELVPAYLSAVPDDPFDPADSPLRYRLLSPGYLIYSLGPDGQDNGGTELDSAGKAFTPGTDITIQVQH